MAQTYLAQRGLCSGARTLAVRLLPAAPAECMLEVKRKHDGSKKSFPIESWLWDPDGEVVVGRWVAPKGNAYGLQEGSWSWGVWGAGVFGEDVGLGAYRLHDADGSLRGYRFDVLDRADAFRDAAGVRTLVFYDLLLDAWLTPDQKLTLEDEDEVVEATSAGRLSASELQSACPTDVAASQSPEGGYHLTYSALLGLRARRDR